MGASFDFFVGDGEKRQHFADARLGQGRLLSLPRVFDVIRISTSTLRNPSLILAAALAAPALTIDPASAQRGGGGSQGGSVGMHTGVGSAAVRAAPTLQAMPMRLPQLSTRSQGAIAPTGSRSAVLRAPNSADPPASKAGALLFLMNANRSGPPSPTPSAPVAPPTSAVGAPVAEIPPLAPLVPADTLTTFGTGRPSVSATTVSPYFSYSAPESQSQAAPILPGGGGGTLEDCMAFWDRATHMTKNEWRAACKRTIHRLDDVTREFARQPNPAKPSQ